jgi:hypothetical protein
MKIISLTAVYMRSEVTRIWAMGLKRLKVTPVVVLSREDPQYHQNYEICQQNKFYTVEYPNDPLGEKLNQVIRYIMDNFRFDYLMNIDSDDLIHPQLWDIYDTMLSQNNPFFGVNKVYFFNLSTKETMISTENCWCAGRLMSRGLLERMKGSPYFDNDCRGLDQRSAAKIEQVTGVKQVLIDTKDFPYVVDIKTFQNLNDWNFIQSYAQPSKFEVIEQNYPKNIIRFLKNIY